MLISLLFDSHVNTIRIIKHSYINNIPVQLTCLEAAIQTSRRLSGLLCFVYLIFLFPILLMQPSQILFLTVIVVDHMYKSYTIIKAITDIVITLINSRPLEPDFHADLI